jgi:hypothetical protein
MREILVKGKTEKITFTERKKIKKKKLGKCKEKCEEQANQCVAIKRRKTRDGKKYRNNMLVCTVRWDRVRHRRKQELHMYSRKM